MERRRRKGKRDEGRGGEGERKKWREEKTTSSNNKVFSPAHLPAPDSSPQRNCKEFVGKNVGECAA